MNLNRFLSPRVVVLAALGIVIALGFIMQRHKVAFLIVTLVIAIVVLAVVMWRMMAELNAAKAGKGIQGDLDKQVEREIEKSTFGQDVVVRNVKAEWDNAMAEFRKSPVGRRLGDRALAQLPMYFVIGPEGAGKSSLIEESGLSSVLRDSKGRPRAVRGVGGGRDFSWWFTEQAFLLDMSGRTLKRSQFDDTEDWTDFLKSLQKQRPERPINGVILVVPVNEVAGGAPDAAATLATTLRERLRDLGHHLGMEFPVYVVFSHCDRIAGFAETFEGLSGDAPDQAWGATLPAARTRTAAVEPLFEAEFRTLVSALGTLRGERIHALADDTQRMRALAFPAQMDRLREGLKGFLGQVFQKGKGLAEGGFLRGFYFVSGHVEGEAVDRVVGAAASLAGLPPCLDAPTPEVARRAWFVPQLWRKIVLRDATLAAASEYARKREAQRRWFLLGGLGGAYVLLTLMFVLFAVNVAKPIRQAERAARTLGQMSEYEVARKTLVPLDAMRAALERLEWNRTHKTFGMRVGAYAGDAVIESAREFYVRSAEKYLLQPIASDVRSTLERQLDADSTRFADLFYQYQVYRLLMDPHATVGPEDAVVLGKVLVRMLRPELEHVPPDTLHAYILLAREQARCLADHGEPKRRFGEFDEALAARAIATLRARWNDWPTLYDDMIADANEAIAPLTIDEVLKEAGKKQELFQDSPPLAGAYTKVGWETFVRPRLAIMKHVVQSEQDPELNREMGDKVRGLTADLGRRYADDYVAAWSAFLSNLRGRPLGRHGRNSLQREASFDSEILAVLKRVTQETDLEGGPDEVRTVRKRFEPFFKWLEHGKRDGFMANLKAKVPFLRSEADKSDHEAYQAQLLAAFKAKADGELIGVDGPMYNKSVVNTVSTFAEPGYVHYDPAVARAFQRVLLVMGGAPPASGSAVAGGGGGAGGGAAGQVNDPGDPVQLRNDWATQIQGGFGVLANGYPFNGGGADVKIADFGAFFKPGGPIDAVYNAHFKGRMDTDGKVIGRLVAGTSPEMCAWMAKAMAIQAAFSWSGADPKLLFDVKTSADQLKPAGALHSVTWIVGESSMFYEMGAPDIRTLTWSAETSGRGSSISADVNGNVVDGPTVEGEWGLFHVLDGASLAPAGGGRVRATWKFKGVTMSVEITPKTRVHPFASGFMRLSSPPAAGGN